jgi:hypothetical protein
VPDHLFPPGRSSDSRIFLLSGPSHFAFTKQWLSRISSPITAAGPFPNRTGFPFKQLVPDDVFHLFYFYFLWLSTALGYNLD